MLVSVDVLGVGFDVPGASCGIMARPTMSPIVYFQQVGRIPRPADDKSDAILLDHAGNTIRFGLPIDFELPDLTADDRKVAKASKKLKPKTKTCKHCDAVMLPTDFICPACGMDQPRPVSKVAYVDGDLIEFSSGKDGTREYSIADRKEFYLETRYLWEIVWNKSPDHACKIAFARSKQKFGIAPPWSWRSLAIKQVTPEVMNWNKSENIRYQHRRQ